VEHTQTHSTPTPTHTHTHPHTNLHKHTRKHTNSLSRSLAYIQRNREMQILLRQKREKVCTSCKLLQTRENKENEEIGNGGERR